jgi:hypothetical protein
MTRDVRERLCQFSGVEILVKRLALNYDQVQTWKPPENPAKETDSRYKSYIVQFGESSWELDAIEPRTLASIVTEAVEDLRDDDLWDDAVEREDEMKEDLQAFVKSYQKKNGGKQP